MDRSFFLLVSSAALGCAIVGGMFYGFSSFVMRALAQIAPEQGVAAMNSINRVVITPSFMLAFMGTALLCLLLAVGSFVWWPQANGKLALAGALLYLVACFGLTMAVNQPMNLRLAALAPADALAYWPHYVSSWTVWNHVRTAASLLSAACFVAALLVKP
jgi:uncharacterized membrane protein